jgi:NAD(P)-dependent dehydrogenase (short-subunit alcohol dehydrogenase family)
MHVFITGTSSGIGRAIVMHLAARAGYHLFAGVRDGSAFAELPENVTPVVIDVTIPASIDGAFTHVSGRIPDGEELTLVNNAGTAVFGPLEHIPMERIRRQFEVNLFGTIAVTQAVLPLIRRQGGRIVNIGSMNGRLALPVIGPYCATKFGLRSITDSLRLELSPWRIPVILIEAGVVSTRLVRRATDELKGALTDEVQKRRYGRVYARMERMAERCYRLAARPEAVARVVRRAIEDARPRAYYRVGGMRGLRSCWTRWYRCRFAIGSLGACMDSMSGWRRDTPRRPDNRFPGASPEAPAAHIDLTASVPRFAA